MKISGKHIIFCAAFSCIMLSACTGKDDASDNQSNFSQQKEQEQETELPAIENEITFPKQYKKEINQVVFDVTVEIEDGFTKNMLFASTAWAQKADVNLAREKFAEGKETQEQWEDVSEDENGDKFTSWYSEFTDKTSLYVANNSVSYTTPFFDDIYRSFHLGENEEVYNKDRTFDFGTPDKCVAELNTCLEDVGYTLDDFKYTCYALDHETMQAQENLIYMDENGDIDNLDGSETDYKDAWTSEDDCYYICMEQKYQGLPVYFGSNSWKEDAEENMPVHAVYSNDGIKRLEIASLTPLYNFVPGDTQIELLPFEQVIETIAKKYGDILTDATYTVKRATLYQMPVKQKDKNYMIRPAWLFEIKETGKDPEAENEEFEYTLIALIDAETGEELNP